MNTTRAKAAPPKRRLTLNQRQMVEDYLAQYRDQMYKCIHKTVQRRWLSDEEFEDLRGAAFEGLCKAAKNFRDDKGAEFKTFAYLNISSAVKDVWKKNNQKEKTPENKLVSLEQITSCGLAIKEFLTEVGEVNIQEYDKIKQYLATLSDDAKLVLSHLLEGRRLSELQKLTGFDTKYLRRLLLELQKYERVRILRNEYEEGLSWQGR